MYTGCRARGSVVSVLSLLGACALSASCSTDVPALFSSEPERGGAAGTEGASEPRDESAAVVAEWGNVRFDGGGFATGIVASSAEQGLFYVRTDVGGMYRWDEAASRWRPLMDWVSQRDVGLLGVESFALDPQNPSRLYALAGTSYFSGGKTAILRSEDYGDTFEVVDVTEQFRAHGNGMGRQTGEKLAVDPNNPDVIFCGSRTGGLFKSLDAGRTWNSASDLGATTSTDLLNENGVSFVLFDSASSVTKEGTTSRLFLGLSSGDSPLYVSRDGGQSFDAVAGAPKGLLPLRAALEGDKLYVVFSGSPGPHSVSSGSFYSFDVTAGSWENLTPPNDSGTGLMGDGAEFAHGFGGISVDPADSSHLLLTTLNFYGGQTRYADGRDAYGDRVYESRDGGETWSTRFTWADPSQPDNANVAFQDSPWIGGQAIHWAGHIAFDPFDSRQAWVISGNGVFRNRLVGEQAGLWEFASRGIEETVPLDIVSVVGGPLVTAIGDFDGATYSDIALPARRHEPNIGTTYSLGYAPLAGAFARVGYVTDYSTDPAVSSNVLYYSTDQAKTWTQLPEPMGRHGLVVLSADGEVILHRPEESTAVFRSADRGETWSEVAGLGGEARGARIVGDPVDPDLFYVLDERGTLMRSSDKGLTFVEAGSVEAEGGELSQNSNGLIRTVPGRQGHLWAPLDQLSQDEVGAQATQNGLAYSEDGGATWSRIPGVRSAQAVGLGKAPEDGDYETLFIWGSAGAAGATEAQVGIYASMDKGQSWVRVNDEDTQFGGPGNGQFVVGDMNVFGRVYMSTAGRGLVYGQIQR